MPAAREALETLQYLLSKPTYPWGTVREDLSPYGNAWESVSHTTMFS